MVRFVLLILLSLSLLVGIFLENGGQHMKVFFRSLEDGSFITLEQVARLTVQEDKYLLSFHPEYFPLLESYPFRFFSLMGVSHE